MASMSLPTCNQHYDCKLHNSKAFAQFLVKACTANDRASAVGIFSDPTGCDLSAAINLPMNKPFEGYYLVPFAYV